MGFWLNTEKDIAQKATNVHDCAWIINVPGGQNACEMRSEDMKKVTEMPNLNPRRNALGIALISDFFLIGENGIAQCKMVFLHAFRAFLFHNQKQPRAEGAQITIKGLSQREEHQGGLQAAEARVIRYPACLLPSLASPLPFHIVTLKDTCCFQLCFA